MSVRGRCTMLALALVVSLFAGAYATPAPAPSTPMMTAPAPGPVSDPCLRTQLVGPGPYQVYGRNDALVQKPREVFICPGGLRAVATAHQSVPSISFPGPAKNANSQWNAFTTLAICADGITVLAGPAEPPSVQYTQPLLPDILIFGDGIPAEGTASYYNVSATASNYWLHNILGEGQDPVESDFYRPDTAISVVKPQAGHKFIGLITAKTYGGIDYLEFVTAPTCYDAALGQALRVNNFDVMVGEVFTETVAAPAPMTPPTCPLTHQGPGQTYAAADSSAGPAPPASRLVCPNGAYITQWNVRSHPWPESWTGERVAYVGALCSDGTYLSGTPQGQLTVDGPYGRLGGDVYFTAGGSSGTNDRRGWNSIATAVDSPTMPVGLGQIIGSTGASRTPPQDLSPSARDMMAPIAQCPEGERAIGYIASAYPGGGVTILDVLCQKDCSAAASAPTPAGAGSPPLNPGGDTPAQQAYGCGSTVQAHVGPGGYKMLGMAPEQGQYYTSVCPAGSYIREFHVGTSSYDAATRDYDVVVSLLQGFCSADTAGAAGGQALTRIITGMHGVNDTQSYEAFEETAGFSTFELTNPMEPQLSQFLGVDEAPMSNYSIACPYGFVAIGYTVSPFQHGIDYFDIICGPKLPAGCDPVVGPSGSGGQSAGNTVTGPPTSGGTGATNPPFVYVSDPTGRQSWGNDVVMPNGKPAPPPPRRAAGNTIDRSTLTAGDVYLRAVISATGRNVNPFSDSLIAAFNKTIATIIKVPQRNCTFLSSRFTPATTGRRHLLELEGPGRQLLQSTDGTANTTWSARLASSDAVYNAANDLGDSFTSGAFLSTLSANGVTGLSVKLESVGASDTQAATQASETCPRKFGTICIHNSRLSKGDIAGIIIGGCVFIILVVGLAAWLIARRRRRAAV